MSLYVSGFDKTHEKRLSTIISHAKEALNQLFGTLKSVKRNESIFTFSEKEPILFNRNLPVHAIAIISEFLSPVEKWDKIADYVREIHNKTGASVHVMDVSEFKNVINLANGSLDRLEGLLNQRFNGFLKHNILKIFSVDSSLQSTHPSEIFDKNE